MFEIFTMLIRNMLLTGAYQNQVFKDPLSVEEEAYYIEKLKNNDNHAREVLIEHNLRLVAHIVKKYSENKDEVDACGDFYFDVTLKNVGIVGNYCQ